MRPAQARKPDYRRINLSLNRFRLAGSRTGASPSKPALLPLQISGEVGGT